MTFLLNVEFKHLLEQKGYNLSITYFATLIPTDLILNFLQKRFVLSPSVALIEDQIKTRSVSNPMLKLWRVVSSFSSAIENLQHKIGALSGETARHIQYIIRTVYM